MKGVTRNPWMVAAAATFALAVAGGRTIACETAGTAAEDGPPDRNATDPVCDNIHLGDRAPVRLAPAEPGTLSVLSALAAVAAAAGAEGGSPTAWGVTPVAAPAAPAPLAPEPAGAGRPAVAPPDPVLRPGLVAATPGSPAAAGSARVSNVWVEAELRQVLQDITLQTGVPVIPDQTVQGVVSLAVKEMPLVECLERVCAVGGFSFMRVKDYFVVGRADPGTDLFRRLALIERVKLRHVSAEQVKAMLPAPFIPYVTYDPLNGAILVSAPDGLRERVLEAVEAIDVASPQVTVDAVVFELTEEGSKQLGLDWEYANVDVALKAENLIGTVTYDSASDVATLVEGTLRAIVQDQKGQVLANPRIAVMNGKPAEIFIGQEKYFSLLSGYAVNPYFRLESIKSGVTLKVTPYVGADRHATLAFESEVSDVVNDWTRDPAEVVDGVTNGPLPVVTRRRAQTVVAVTDGQTIVIGGLLRDQHRKMIEKVPLLGDLPLVGPAFRVVRDRTEQKEIVILLTTRFMSGRGSEDPAGAAGTLSRLYESPLDVMGQTARGFCDERLRD